MTITARMALVEIVVADMAKALAFYRLLGLEIPASADAEPHVEVAVGGLRLAFDTEAVIASFHDGWTPPAGGGRVALAFEVPDPASVDALYATVVEAGYASELAPFDAFWGQRYATVRDPDGTGIDLFAPLPA
jgi:uncharacterized glyoxalase superfamily protein PhnB